MFIHFRIFRIISLLSQACILTCQPVAISGLEPPQKLKKGYLIDCYSSQHGGQCCPEKYTLKGKMTAEGKAFLFLPEAVQKTEIKQNHTGFIL